MALTSHSTRRPPSPTLSRRAWGFVGVLLAFPLYVHIVGGSVRLAKGHAETRLLGFYYPVLVPLAIALVLLWRRGQAFRPVLSKELRSLLLWAGVSLLSIYLAVLSGFVFDRDFPAMAAAPFVVQSAAPIVLLVVLVSRAPSEVQRSGLLRGFVTTTTWVASVLVLLRWVIPYDPQIGYPDTFGSVGIPASLRFFPTVVATAASMAFYAGVNSGRRRLFHIVPLLGSVALVLYSHSRTALVILVVGGMLASGRLYRRSALAFVGLNICLALIAVGAISSGGATSVERLVQGSGDSDANRLGRTLSSLSQTFDAPFGARFVPSEDVETRAGVRIKRVVTAENQFGTLGVSAGPLGLIANVALVGSCARIALGALGSASSSRRLAGCGVICLAVTSFFQISVSHSLVGPLLAVFTWLALEDRVLGRRGGMLAPTQRSVPWAESLDQARHGSGRKA